MKIKQKNIEMEISFNDEISNHRSYSRREFSALSTFAAAGFLAGCAINPVTGQRQLMLVSKDWEIEVDQENAPHQFSTDYGKLQDDALNKYLHQLGREMAPHTHRPDMPYSFQEVNATYINAYAFPGGSIAATRGILLSLESEAELAALLGHEMGHVNARHTAQQMSKGMLPQAVVGGIAVYAGTKGQHYGQAAAQLGMLGAGALLASYSRDNEREADRLGMTYMTQSGYGSEGFVQLMSMLNGLHTGDAGAASLLFASQPLHRERYMDHTAALRTLKPACRQPLAAKQSAHI